MKLLDRLLRGPPALDWIQLEVTTRCDASCSYCPQAEHRSRWRESHVPLELVGSLEPSFARAGLVFLQGWGEPLLHPRFLDVVRSAKRSGAAVGTATNGKALTEALAGELVEAGLDVIAFSLAGTSAATNDSVRRGTSLDAVVRAMETLRELKARRGVDRPRVHVAYMLLRSALGELEGLPDALAGLGVSQVVVSSLSLVVRPELLPEARLVSTPEERLRLLALAEEVRRRAGAAEMEVCFQILSPFREARACPERPERSVFVGADGRVFPCVLLGVPVSGGVPCALREDGRPYRRLPFGDLHRAPLGTAWRGGEHRAFRRQHEKRSPAGACAGCPKRAIDDLLPEAGEEGFPLPSPWS